MKITKETPIDEANEFLDLFEANYPGFLREWQKKEQQDSISELLRSLAVAVSPIAIIHLGTNDVVSGILFLIAVTLFLAGWNMSPNRRHGSSSGGWKGRSLRELPFGLAGSLKVCLDAGRLECIEQPDGRCRWTMPPVSKKASRASGPSGYPEEPVTVGDCGGHAGGGNGGDGGGGAGGDGGGGGGGP